ncbi:hypothetical protein AVEN_84953-1 [Araneus ventricosus]|uniref:Uncharacterized protein n=1 Tax=Araneus ventricosus TaxID=182803 RepID=A0A4Y2BYD2_ARAVE|nr:hypothetical protein AVEN_84953-1 [Araneus ventricosus]
MSKKQARHSLEAPRCATTSDGRGSEVFFPRLPTLFLPPPLGGFPIFEPRPYLGKPSDHAATLARGSKLELKKIEDSHGDPA